MVSFDFDAVVYGAGPVGAAVALGLQQRGHRVVVREKRTEYEVIGDAGKSINLSLSTRGNALMKQLGVYEDLQSTVVRAAPCPSRSLPLSLSLSLSLSLNMFIANPSFSSLAH